MDKNDFVKGVLKCLIVIGGFIAIVIASLAVGQWAENDIHKKGYDYGYKEGVSWGYTKCYNDLGVRWLGSYERFYGFTKEYGNLHNTPWNKFTVEEKVVIAMYGGSGSKLKESEMREFEGKYGTNNR